MKPNTLFPPAAGRPLLSVVLSALALAAPAGAWAIGASDVALTYGSTYKLSGMAGGDVTHTGYNQVGPYGGNTAIGQLFGTTSLVNGPVAFASVSTSGNSYDAGPYYVIGGMQTSLYYQFEVIGPSAATVPILIDGRMAMAFGGSGVAGAYSQVSVRVTDDYPYNSHNVASDTTPLTYCSSSNSDNCNTAFELHVNVVSGTATQAGQIGSVLLLAEADYGGIYFEGASASAFADPLISIAPSFLASNPGYSLVFNGDVVNQLAPVPEASTAAMWLAGLAVMGRLVRRRRT
jgi:hypothetical protein